MEEKEIRIVEFTNLSVESREVRAADGSATATKVIRGRAVVFNRLSQNLGWFREQIDPRAFDECDMSDVVALKNHDNNILLGRTPDTLKLTVTAEGLDFEAFPPDTQAARDAVAEIEAKMIKGCSFQFAIAPGGSDWDQDPATGGDIRTVKKIAKLYDVGPVTIPAYLQTSTDVAKRDRDSAISENRMGKKKKTKDAPSFDETFIDQMIPHHQAAIDMATEALDKASHQELKDLAQSIIDTQSAEIAKMEGWKSEWFGDNTSERSQPDPTTQPQNQQETPASTVAPLSVYKRKLQLLTP